jgi:flagellar secretion chaperone FliS
MNLYQQRVLEGASGVELTVALYDGMIRFLHEAIVAVEREDVSGRRIAIKRAMDILIHLQGTLRMDIGGKPAEALSEFYVAMFALMLQGSVGASRQKFDKAIACIQNVRDAWRKVANVPLPTGARQPSEEFSQQRVGISESEHEMASSWTA